MAARVLAGALVLCALALVSCGEGDEAAAIEETIVASAKADDPADCTRFQTQAFLEQSAKLEDMAAVEACEEVAADPAAEDAKAVSVFDVNIDGTAATATARFAGSAYDGQTVKFRLVKRDGAWKLDQLLGFVHLDAEKMVVELGREMLRMANSPQEAQLFSCVIGLLERMDDEELEAFFVDYGPEDLRAMVESCVSGSQAL